MIHLTTELVFGQSAQNTDQERYETLRKQIHQEPNVREIRNNQLIAGCGHPH